MHAPDDGNQQIERPEPAPRKHAAAPLNHKPPTPSAAPDPQQRRRPIGFYVAVAVAAIALIVACVLVFRSCSDTTGARDPNAEVGQLDGKSQEEIQAELDRVVDEGMFNVAIATTVEFADGASEGELRIENVPGNRYLMKVEIARDDTGEVVYASGLIEPNRHIQKAALSEDLDAGTYPCTAVFYAFDTETEELIGQAAVQMTILVAN
ncbi:hypothetical protein [Raoultibacter phocaeensis]|uniref:hypothetical protein n=1 Tax=Raoultibacter phocaeensis TaxID=2479841 RepID=UPI001119C671|nr:hypothetical protein [Raoultibacter phocaeensis]